MRIFHLLVCGLFLAVFGLSAMGFAAEGGMPDENELLAAPLNEPSPGLPPKVKPVPLDPQKEAEKAAAAVQKRETKTEWFSLRIGGGNYGFAAEYIFFTLRWPKLFWEVLRVGGVILGPGFGGRGYGVASYAGSVCGYPLFLDAAKTKEFRFKGGLFAGDIEQEQGPFMDFFGPPHKKWMAYGPFVMAEASFVYHPDGFTFETGITFMAATWAKKGHYPHPLLVGFFGWRF